MKSHDIPKIPDTTPVTPENSFATVCALAKIVVENRKNPLPAVGDWGPRHNREDEPLHTHEPTQRPDDN